MNASTNNKKLTGADILVSGLIANKVKTIFGLPGGQLDNLFDAIHRQKNELDIVRARQEQSAAYMAFGAARSTGLPSVFSVVPGPGLMNTMGALATAWAANAPILSLSGQIPSEAIGSGRGYLHEIPDQLATMRTLLKKAERIEKVESAPKMINEAFIAMLTGRPGPVHLEMSPDLMGNEIDFNEYRDAFLPPPPCANANDIDLAVSLLKKARKPLIYVGGGAQHAAREVNELSSLIEAPVTCFRSGRGIVDDRNYRSQVFPAGRRLWKNADVVFAIGTRLKYPQLYWGLDKNIKIIRLDIDPKEFEKYPDIEIALVGDAKTSLETLLPLVADEMKSPPKSREEELVTLKKDIQAELEENVRPQMEYLKAIRDVLPENGIFCDEITQVGFTSWFGMPIYRPRGHINCGFQGTLGYGYASALGVKVVNPDTPVVSISGDGGFLFTATEMATSIEYGINLVTIIFNDNRYANVYRQQKEWFGERFIASELHNPDFVTMARSFGLKAFRAESPNALRASLEKAFSNDEPTLIEVKQEHDLPTPWRYILEPPVRGKGAL